MIVGYALWVLFWTLAGGWMGHAGFDETFIGLVLGWWSGIVTSIIFAGGGGDLAAGLLGSAIETFADVLDD